MSRRSGSSSAPLHFELHAKLAAGKHTIKLDFKYDGPGMGKSGTGTLSVDGTQVAQGKIERTIPTRFSLDETPMSWAARKSSADVPMHRCATWNGWG